VFDCFSGGVFLAAGLSLLLLYSISGFHLLKLDDDYAFIFFLIGLLIPFFIEKIIILNPHDHFESIVNEKNPDNENQVKNEELVPSYSIGIYILFFMLSIHAFIEGLALGVQDDKEDTTAILIAIVSHEFFSSFALGVSLVSSSMTMKKIIQFLFTFSISTPCGIIIGILLSSILHGFVESFLAESLKAVAAGTFVYVALLEVIMEEFKDEDHRHGEKKHEEESSRKVKLMKFFMIVLGIILMSLISIQTKHRHV